MAITAIAALFSGPSPVSAQTTTATAADILFREAHRQLAAGQVHEACIHFAESQRLDPGVGTLLNLALCHEREGRLAAAWSEFAEVARQAGRSGQPDRQAFAQRKAAELEPRLSRIIVTNAASAGAEQPGDTVAIDGVPLTADVLRTGIPVDPGKHRVVVTSPTRGEWAREVVVEPAETAQVEAPPVRAAEASRHPPAPSERDTIALARVPMAARPRPVDTTRRAIGYGALAASGVAAGFGAVYALTSASRARGADDARAARHDDAAAEFDRQSTLLRTYAIVAGTASAAALAVGIYLVVTSHRQIPQVSRLGLGAFATMEPRSTMLVLPF